MQKIIEKAATLIEALPYIQDFKGATVVVKIGGSVMESKEGLESLLTDVAFLSTVGMKTVLVHGGGKAISRGMEKSGITPQFVQGLRVTCDKTMQVVEQVIKRSDGVALPSVGRLSLKELAAFISFARLFVSNSTGPLHIAAAVGVPVIAFYPPIRECSPRRWGPLAEQKAVFVADNALCERCRGGPCQGDDCMDQITVEQALGAARKLIFPGEKN